MYRRIIIVFILLSVCIIEGKAQYDPSLSHYFDMESSFNPATVGKQSKLNIVAAYALDMEGFEHNPRTMFLSGDIPFYALKSQHGAGVSFLNDQIGLLTHQRFTLQYSLKRHFLGGNLGLGAQVSLVNESFDGSKVDIDDSGDPAFSTTDVNGNGVDLGVGIYYQHTTWYLGASVLHANSPVIHLGESNELKLDASYYFTGGYNIKFRNPFLMMKPSVLVKYDDSTWRADLTCRFMYQHEKKQMYSGMTYSPNHSVTFLVGGRFHGVMLGYSYELYTSAPSLGSGSHELFLGYQMDIHVMKSGRNIHKSVRIL